MEQSPLNQLKNMLQNRLQRSRGISFVLILLVLSVIGLFTRPSGRDTDEPTPPTELQETKQESAARKDHPGHESSAAASPKKHHRDQHENHATPSVKKAPISEGLWHVVRAVDGDTIIVRDHRGTQHRIRLLGIDTPEVVKEDCPVEPFGPEASAFTKKMIAKAGNQARLAFDGDQLDQYDRILALVYLPMPEGEVFLNELILREGLARATLHYEFSQASKDILRKAQQEARKAKKNIWSQKK